MDTSYILEMSEGAIESKCPREGHSPLVANFISIQATATHEYLSGHSYQVNASLLDMTDCLTTLQAVSHKKGAVIMELIVVQAVTSYKRIKNHYVVWKVLYSL